MNFPYELVDLIHTLTEQVPAWNGGCGFNHNVHIDYSDCQGEYKFRVMTLSMHAAIGTHMDAPSHCIEGGRCIHDFEVNELCMPCVVIDVSGKCYERYSVSAQDIEHFENTYVSITKSACVMVKTGWEKFWDDPKQYHNNHVFPSVSLEAAELFLERGVSALGIDTLSPDRPEDGFRVHKSLLSAGKIIIENVANLDKMPAVGGHVMVFPIKIKDGTEAPVRLVGLIEK